MRKRYSEKCEKFKQKYLKQTACIKLSLRNYKSAPKPISNDICPLIFDTNKQGGSEVELRKKTKTVEPIVNCQSNQKDKCHGYWKREMNEFCVLCPFVAQWFESVFSPFYSVYSLFFRKVHPYIFQLINFQCICQPRLLIKPQLSELGSLCILLWHKMEWVEKRKL